MGVIYRARQLSLNRVVAIKMIQPARVGDAEMVLRFQAEAEAAAGLHHPNIVAIYETGECEGEYYFSMGYIEGKNLAATIHEAVLPASRAAEMVRKIAQAIHYAHQQGILHRDLKPSNILVDEAGEPHVADFGLARRLEGDSTLTLSGQVFGSPSFIPPEQAAGRRGAVGTAGDVYGLGGLLYYTLTGRPPFVGGTLETTLAQVLHQEPVPPRMLNASIPRDLETLCLKCLEKEPSRRYATAAAVADELGRFARAEPILARPLGPAGKTWRWCQRRPGPASLVASLIVVFSLGLTGVVWQWRRAEWIAGEEVRQRVRAEGEARRAEVAEARARKNQYVAEMNLAQHALAVNNLGRARSLLEKYRPDPTALAAPTLTLPSDPRAWEWRYLWPLCQSDVAWTLCQHSNSIGAVAFAGAGRLLAARDTFGNVMLWDIATRQEVWRRPNDIYKFRAMAVAPDGNRVALLSATLKMAPIIELWDVTTRQRLGELPQPAWTLSLAFSPDGNTLAVYAADRTVRVWDLATKQVIASFTAASPSSDHKGVVLFSPDGGALAIGDTDGRVRLIHLGSNTERANFQAHPEGDGITALAFSGDSQFLVSASGYSDGTIRLWETATGRSAGQLSGHLAWVTALAVAPDGRTLASASADQTIRLWDLARRQCQATLRGDEAWTLAFSPDGANLASGGKHGAIGFREPRAKPKASVALTLPVPMARLEFAPDSRTMVTVNLDGSVSSWDTASARPEAAYGPLGTNNTRLTISPDGRLLLVGNAWGSVAVWDRIQQRELTNFVAHAARIEHLQFCLGGRLLVSAGADHTIKMWDPMTWRETKRQNIDHHLWVFRVSSDAGRAAIANAYTLNLWDLASGKKELALIGSFGWIGDLAVSPDDKLLALAGSDSSARLFDLATRREVASLRGQLLGVHSVAFSPDGRRLATGSDLKEALKLWDVETFQEVATLEGQGTCFQFAAFSPDGDTITAINLQGTAHLWRAPSFARIAAIESDRIEKPQAPAPLGPK